METEADWWPGEEVAPGGQSEAARGARTSRSPVPRGSVSPSWLWVGTTALQGATFGGNWVTGPSDNCTSLYNRLHIET